MPITTRQMAVDAAPVPEFIYGDGTVNLSYTPSRMTEDTLATIQSLDTSEASRPLEDFTHVLNEVLIFLLVDWDVYDIYDPKDPRNNVKTPIDDAHLRKLPIYFRMAMITHIVDAFSPNEIGATETPNAPSSSTTMELATVPPFAAS